MSFVILLSLSFMMSGCNNLTYRMDETVCLFTPNLYYVNSINPSEVSSFSQRNTFWVRSLQLKEKQTLTELLGSFDLNEYDIHLISEGMSNYINLNKLKIGQKFDLKFIGEKLDEISLNLTFNSKLSLKRSNASWKAFVVELSHRVLCGEVCTKV